MISGIFPDNLKIAKISPIFKKGDHHQIENYRPISLLLTISKIFEKVVFIQLYDFFSENNFLLVYPSQYGFREKHSTEPAALETVDILPNKLDNKQTPAAIFIDLSKAFDTIDHHILLNKLRLKILLSNGLLIIYLLDLNMLKLTVKNLLKFLKYLLEYLKVQFWGPYFSSYTSMISSDVLIFLSLYCMPMTQH